MRYRPEETDFDPRCAKMASSDEVGAKVLKISELSSYLRIHRSTIYRLLKNRELPAFRVGSDWRFSVEAIDRWRLAQVAKVETQN
jgi:excisionase family DNA binding protein